MGAYGQNTGPTFGDLKNDDEFAPTSTRHSVEHEFGIDIEEFLNHRSEIFAHFRNKEYSVPPLTLNSVEDAILEHDLRERDYENMVFSAANLNRPIEKCHVCKLDHGPLQPDIAEISERRKLEK